MESTSALANIALLLDIDGTLVDFANSPNEVKVEAGLPELVSRLHAATGGAAAFVSGRPIEHIDCMFEPFRGAAIGLHGMQIRYSSHGAIIGPQYRDMPVGIRHAILGLANRLRARIEDKGTSIALHYRDPALGDRLGEALKSELARHAPGWRLLHGRRVFEIQRLGIDKGVACRRLLAAGPFAARRPIFLGDDGTDLDAFELIRQRGGLCVAVGERIAHRADLRLADPTEARAWLQRLLHEGAAAWIH